MYEAFMCVPEFGVFLGEVFLGFVFRIVSPLSVINICTEYIYIYRLLIKNVMEIQNYNCLKCYRNTIIIELLEML